MLVQHLLNEQGARGVITVSQSERMREIANIMAHHNIGSILVTDEDGTLRGLISERDIVRVLANKGPQSLEETVGTHMTRNLKTTEKSATVQDVLERMTQGRFRHMPVVEEGKLLGIVTIGDAVKAQLDQLQMENKALEGMIAGN
ncbi:MAG: CBS domain-containing protein [Paracoccaceae bacterium]|jgi:CBS domain-containing protein